MDIKVKKVHPDAILPVYATDGSACFDLHIAEDMLIYNGQHMVMGRTGLAFEIPTGFAMFIYSRSGLAKSKSIRLANCVGVIDSDYRGEVMIMFKSDSPDTGTSIPPHVIHEGDRIAQAVIMPVPKVSFVEVDELSETERGQGGFGSTGQHEMVQKSKSAVIAPDMHEALVQYWPTSTARVFKIIVKGFMIEHVGYVCSDEGGMFSSAIYDTEYNAETALLDYKQNIKINS